MEILVLYSVALISNIGLLTAEALTGEPNKKEPIFNKKTSHDNYEVETIFIGDFCVFDKKSSTAGACLVRYANIRGDQLIVHHKKNFKNI